MKLGTSFLVDRSDVAISYILDRFQAPFDYSSIFLVTDFPPPNTTWLL